MSEQAAEINIDKARVKDGSAWARKSRESRPAAVAVAKPGNLDSRENQALHKKLFGYYVRELRRQEDNRYEMSRDEDFYDNIQWDPSDAAILKERGQVPIVYNVIASTINWIIGTEKRSRTDFKILPRRKDEAKPAERKSQLMKYLSDVNRTPFSKSRAFEDQVKVGVGWLECGLQSDDDGEPVYARSESWRYILWDSAAQEYDLSDARYMCRAKWADEDVAISLFHNRKGMIEQSVVNSESFVEDNAHGDAAMDDPEQSSTMFATDLDDVIYSRKRVRLIEVWYRAPLKVDKLKGGDFSGEIYDPEDPAHQAEVADGKAAIVRATSMRMHVAIMTVKGLLHVSLSPYRHNRFPFTPIWAYRRGRNNLPYGVIRGLRDIQADINKRASKALAILSSNKVVMDDDAVEDIDLLADEVADPNGIIRKKKGSFLELNVDRDLAPAHLELMSRGIAMIQSVSGVTDENMGRTTNARSGVAIQARQNQGALATSGLFDNYRLSNQIHGEKELSLIEQFFTDEKAFRITNMRGTPEYVTINDGLPENDIVRSKADFVISEDEWRASVRQAQTAELMELLMQIAPVAPQIVVVMLDLIVEKMDIPNRDEMVRRIRQITGMRDPDAEEPTPEEIQMAQEKAEAAALQKAGMIAELKDKEAAAALKAAQAKRMGAEVQKTLAAIAGTNVGTQKAALEAALQMISAPPIVPVADGVLHEAGFRSRTEDEDDAMLEQAQAAQAEQAAMEQQAAMRQQGTQPLQAGAMQEQPVMPAE